GRGSLLGRDGAPALGGVRLANDGEHRDEHDDGERQHDAEHAVRMPAVGATTTALDATKRSEPTTSGSLRPNRSESGPNTSWPAATPTRNAASVSCTPVASVARSLAICGKAGR